jgi:hypothetical protein
MLRCDTSRINSLSSWVTVTFPSGDGKRLVVRADEKVTAFMELEAAA